MVSLLDSKGDAVTSASFGNTCGNLNSGLSFDTRVSYLLHFYELFGIFPLFFTTLKLFSLQTQSEQNCLNQKFKIESTTGEPIQIFDVDVFMHDNIHVIIALHKPATQSLTYKNNKSFDASKVVDGISTSFSHTATNNKSAWLEGDLTAPYGIEWFDIFNRWCKDATDPMGYLCRLANATFTTYNKNGRYVIKLAIVHGHINQPLAGTLMK
jgi:hypothetical protein